MQYEEFLAIPMAAVVEFRVTGDERTWEAWLASDPIPVQCEGGEESSHDCFVVHTEPIAFYCVDLQIISANWPYEDSHSEYGRDFALVPIENVLGVVELQPEK